MATRKLGRTPDQRMAILRNQTTALIWNGKIVTTEQRAKEVRSIAEKLITLAVKEYKNEEIVKKEVFNDKHQTVEAEKHVDKPSKLAARRRMMAYLYDVPAAKEAKESKKEYAERTKERAHAVIEKLFRDIAPKADARITDGKKGGYTRMLKLGPRRGDAAEMVVLEIIQ